MRDASYLVALIGGIALLGAMAAWWNVLRRPEAEPAGGRLGAATARDSSAALATLMAFGLCATAAIMAILGWLF